MNQKSDEEEIIFLELANDKGYRVARTGHLEGLPEKFSLSPNENYKESGLRNIYRRDARGSVRLIVREDAPSFRGTTAVHRASEIYLSLIPKFKQIETNQRQSFDALIKRFAHNLIKFQTRFKEPFERLISDKVRGRPFSEVKSEIERRIKENTSSAADDVATLSFRATDLDAQIETLRVLGGYADNNGTFLNSNLKKAIYRLTNPFVSELTKKEVNIVIDIAEHQGCKVNVVHGLFNVSIWQIFDNICKYILPESTIKVEMIYSSPKKLLISMISVTIDQDELNSVFDEGFRGRHAKKFKTPSREEGTGIGLSIVKRALKFMKSNISVSNNGFVKEWQGTSYSKHTFTIEFNG